MSSLLPTKGKVQKVSILTHPTYVYTSANDVVGTHTLGLDLRGPLKALRQPQNVRRSWRDVDELCSVVAAGWALSVGRV
jgi:hypothetical protein